MISRQMGLKVPIPKVAGVATSAVGIGLQVWVRWDDKAKGTFNEFIQGEKNYHQSWVDPGQRSEKRQKGQEPDIAQRNYLDQMGW